MQVHMRLCKQFHIVFCSTYIVKDNLHWIVLKLDIYNYN